MIYNKSSTNKYRGDKGLYPDMFLSEKEKNSPDHIAYVNDYFAAKAMEGYKINSDTFAKNYSFVKGDINLEDFYENDAAKDFIMDLVDEETPLADYVQNYSIMSQPINTLKGELANRPDNTFVKAFDAESRSEELRFKTEILNNFIISRARDRIMTRLSQNQDVDINDPEVQDYIERMTEEDVAEEITSYTSQAEKWGSRMLEALKMEFNLDELKEDAFDDLLKVGRLRYHIYKNNSSLGFGAEVLNPKNVVVHKSPDKKYTRDAHAASIISVMSISEIMERFPLSKEEVDHLRKKSREGLEFASHQSNLFTKKTGFDSIHYNTYHEGTEEERMYRESMILAGEEPDDLKFKSLGDYYVVCQTYVLSKVKIGKLTYVDEDGFEQVTTVGDSYKSGEHPQEIDLEWGYENQWWHYVKIGDDVYFGEPLEILPYLPIIGVDFEARNASIKGLVDLMKPWQMIVNVCMNQLWELFQKEQGVLLEFNWRKIPRNTDSEHSDALQEWLTQAEELGLLFNDDSLENMQVAQANNTNTTKVLDLTRSQEMQTRLNIVMQIKQLSDSLIGLTPERLGGSSYSGQTATMTNASLTQSFSQTEPWFAAHEYVTNQFYQALLDTAQYFESQKEFSTVSNISSEGEHSFIMVNGPDIKLRDLRVFVTSRGKDWATVQQLQALAQPMLQNGADFYTVAKLFDSTSIRAMHDAFKEEKNKRDQIQQQQFSLQQQQIEAEREANQARLQAEQTDKMEERAWKAQQNELDRISKERVALLNAAGRDTSVLADSNNNNMVDALEFSKETARIDAANREYQLQQQKLQGDIAVQQRKIENERAKIEEDKAFKSEELRIREKKIDVDLEIAKTNKNQYDR